MGMKTSSIIKKNLILATAFLGAVTANARPTHGVSGFKTASSQKVMSACSAPQSAAELAVNNVRTIVYSGSDMWWDLFGSGNAYYVIPKVDDKSKWTSSNFAGNVWISGIDNGGQLRVAAQTYRQSGIDFWTGPLSQVDGKTSAEICSKYDKIFHMTKDQAADLVNNFTVTQDLRDWPGNNENFPGNTDPYLAPWVDINGVLGGDGYYDPETGDRPYYDLSATGLGKDNQGLCKAKVFGDETLWWVYNDNGGVHTATGGLALSVEVRAQAFAFKTTDDINNMTFYNYQLVNRSSFTLTKTYMSVWTDADLGYYGDDYIGCDVKRGLGYIYNGDNYDESVSGTNGYGTYIPSLGCDFFQGPFADVSDGLDNDKDGCVDCTNILDSVGNIIGTISDAVRPEQIIMSSFTYFNNSFPGVPLQMTDPQNAQQTRNYMTGFWRDGTPFTCGGNAYGGSVPSTFVYPDDTDPAGVCGTGWTEKQAGNVPGDRRFIQSAGPFTLKPGAVNYITVGLPWARTSVSGDAWSSVALVKAADDKAQALFDNCFQVLNGPEAPDLTIQELENELILYLTNKPGSNNYLNQYKEKDVTILGIAACGTNTILNNPDPFYRFEGYKIYQLKDASVGQADLTNANKAKLAFQCDVKNGVTKLINFSYDQAIGADVPQVMAEAAPDAAMDQGIQTSFHFTKDLFSSSADQKVINNKSYYFMVVAYAYNNYFPYKEDEDCTNPNGNKYGQKKPYLEGRKSKKAYGIPHIPDPEKDGTVSNSYYGYGPKITRVEGQGNGGNYLDLTQASINEILSAPNGRVAKITYNNGAGPINVKVVDPLNVPNSNFAVRFMKLDSVSGSVAYTKTPRISQLGYGKVIADSITWELKDLNSGKVYSPLKSIKVNEEFYFSEIGLSVNLGQTGDCADRPYSKSFTTGDYLGSSIEFSDPTKPWLTGVPDQDGDNPFNWIRSGTFVNANPPTGYYNDYHSPSVIQDSAFTDPDQTFEKILGGTWAPYCLTSAAFTNTNVPGGVDCAGGPATNKLFSSVGMLSPLDPRVLSSVDIVITSDKSKWTHALVVEECDDATLSQNAAKKLELRKSKSVDKQGYPIGDPNCNISEAIVDTINYGLGWFPGYAINIETGERLNIAFGEDSYQQSDNGRDMIWNPTEKMVDFQGSYNYTFGSRHYIYVFGNARTANYGSAAAAQLQGKHIGAGNYSNFINLANSYKYAQTSMGAAYKNIWSDAMWVSLPVLSSNKYKFTNPANIPCDVKVKLRVKKAYRLGYSGFYTPSQSVYLNASLESPVYSVPSNSMTTAQLPNDTVTGSVNNNFGYYTFSTADIYTETTNENTAKNALDLINIVPNPYYGYSSYEQNRIDSRVRITNLPNKCRIKIFTLNGTLVRTINRDVSGQEDIVVKEVSEFQHSKRLSYQDWDLKNQNGIPVASGLYIIHIDVPGVGEKILKWFGVMRPLDLQNY